ncbi:MAG: hypothetical protein V1897_07205, partial [Pseudomonadota bacterium]
KLQSTSSWAKLNLFSLHSSAIRVQSSLDAIAEQGNMHDVKGILSLMNDYLYHVIMFLDRYTNVIEGVMPNYSWAKRDVVFSTEPFGAAGIFLFGLHESERFGAFVVQPTSIFLIRQAIELRVKNALGIEHFSYDGELLKVPLEVLFEVIDNNPRIQFPIKLSILRNIRKWSNYYIHAGVIPSPWIIEWGLHLLAPLFRGGKAGGQSSIFGSVIMEKVYYDKGLADDIIAKASQRFVKKDSSKIRIDRLGSPEAILT